MKKSIIALSVILGASQLSGCNSSDKIGDEIKKQFGFSMEDGAQKIKEGYLPFRFAVVNDREENIAVKIHYKVETGAKQTGQDLSMGTSINAAVRNDIMDISYDMIIGDDYSIQVRPESIKKNVDLTIGEGLLASNGSWTSKFNHAQSDFGYYVIMHSETDHPTETEHLPVVKMALNEADIEKPMAGFVNRVSDSNKPAAESNICVITSTTEGNTLISANLPYNSSSAMFAMDKVIDKEKLNTKFIIVADKNFQEITGNNQEKLETKEIEFAQRYCQIDGKNDTVNYWVDTHQLTQIPEENIALILFVNQEDGDNEKELDIDAIELPNLKWEKET